jgi:hypothetical protein
VEDDWDWTQWEAVEPQRTTYNLQRLPEQPFFKLQFRSKPGQNDWRFNLQGFLLYGTVSGTAKKA